MSRIINTADPGKLRSQHRRTIAEVLRHLMFKRQFDDEAKDMAAALVFALRGIADTIETTVTAWEKRDYYLKADRFRLDWEWVSPAAERLYDIAALGRWEELAPELAALLPRFSDIRIAKFTRDPSAWKGSYQALLKKG
jgi:hypothetical protein